MSAPSYDLMRGTGEEDEGAVDTDALAAALAQGDEANDDADAMDDDAGGAGGGEKAVGQVNPRV